MEQIGTYVIYVIMACALIGALAAIRDDQSGLGKEFVEGLYSIGPIFLISCSAIVLFEPLVRESVAATGDPTYALAMTMSAILINLLPLSLFCVALAVGLRLAPDLMIRLWPPHVRAARGRPPGSAPWRASTGSRRRSPGRSITPSRMMRPAS